MSNDRVPQHKKRLATEQGGKQGLQSPSASPAPIKPDEHAKEEKDKKKEGS